MVDKLGYDQKNKPSKGMNERQLQLLQRRQQNLSAATKTAEEVHKILKSKVESQWSRLLILCFPLLHYRLFAGCFRLQKAFLDMDADRNGCVHSSLNWVPSLTENNVRFVSQAELRRLLHRFGLSMRCQSSCQIPSKISALIHVTVMENLCGWCQHTILVNSLLCENLFVPLIVM